MPQGHFKMLISLEHSSSWSPHHTASNTNKRLSLQSKCSGLVTVRSELQLASGHNYAWETINQHLFISVWQLPFPI